MEFNLFNAGLKKLRRSSSTPDKRASRSKSYKTSRMPVACLPRFRARQLEPIPSKALMVVNPESHVARYFFDIENGDGKTVDGEGTDLVDDAQIRREIGRILVDIARDEVELDGAGKISITVRDEWNAKVYAGLITFSATKLA